jgi:hypothetical protein
MSITGITASIPTEITDRFELHKLKNYLGLIRSLIVNQPEIQWVLIDHDNDTDKSFGELGNFTKDTLENVLDLLTQ